jgi:hypothetical protein
MTKFSIITSQGGNASHKEEYNNIKKKSWTRRNVKIS